MTLEFILQLAALGLTLVTGYAAIKTDLTKAIHKAETAHESANECHARLDRHIEVKH